MLLQGILGRDTPSALDIALERARARAEEILIEQSSGIEGIAEVGHLAHYQHDPIRFGEEILGNKYSNDIKEMMISVRDERVTIAQSANGVGKTFSAADIALWWYCCFPGAQVYTAAAPPEANLRRLLWGEIGARVVKHQASLFSSDKESIGPLTVQRGPLTFLVGVTIPSTGTPDERKSKFSGKHAPHLLFIFDESDGIPPEVYEAVEGCMTGPHTRLLCLFNPKMKVGPVYQKIRDQQAKVIRLSALTHPNVVTGTQVIPSAVDRATTIRRINEWTRPLATLELEDYNQKKSEGKVDPEVFDLPELAPFLIGETTKSDGGRVYPPLPALPRKITVPQFSYMVLGDYPSQSEMQLIAHSWVLDARVRWDRYVAANGEMPPPMVQPILGLDVAEYGSDDCVIAARYNSWVPKLINWNGVDVVVSARRATEVYQTLGAKFCNVDANGVGAGVWPLMRKKGCRAQRIMVQERAKLRTTEEEERSLRYANEQKTEIERLKEQNQATMGKFGLKKDQGYWLLREWLRLGEETQAMLPPDELLIEELTAMKYWQDGSGNIKVTPKPMMRYLLRRSPDRAEALMLTFFTESDSEKAPLNQYNYIRGEYVDEDDENDWDWDGQLPAWTPAGLAAMTFRQREALKAQELGLIAPSLLDDLYRLPNDTRGMIDPLEELLAR